jgi:predicted transcriptional regulator
MAVIAAFVFISAGATRADEQARTILSTRRIGNAYNKFALSLDESDRVSRVVDYLLTSYQPDFAVLRHGELLGAVSRERAIASLSRGAEDELVTSVMVRDIPGVDASASLQEVRQVMDDRNGRIVAVYDRGVYLGLVSADDLTEALVLIAFDDRRRQRAGAPPLPDAIPRQA